MKLTASIDTATGEWEIRAGDVLLDFGRNGMKVPTSPMERGLCILSMAVDQLHKAVRDEAAKEARRDLC